MRKKALITVISALSAVSILCSCSSREQTFPSIDHSSSETVPVSDPDTDESSATQSLQQLSVSLPYSDTTIMRLVKYYYIKENDLIPEDSNGSNIDLQFLDSVDIPWVIDTGYSSFDGLTGEEAQLPDIFMTKDSSSVIPRIAPLDSYLAEDDRYLSDPVILGLFDSSEGDVYSIPNCYSSYVLIGNYDYVPDSGMISHSPSADELRAYLSDINNGFEGVVPLVSASDLGPLYTDNAADGYIGELYAEGLSLDRNDDDSDPRYSRNAAMWISSTDSVSVWSEYYPNRLYFSNVPDFSSGQRDIYDLRSLCISSDCDDIELAVSLALFISYDNDAVSLIYRLENINGIYPLTDSEDVWEVIHSDGGVNGFFFPDSIRGALYGS